MALTSRGIWTPDSTDAYALTTHLATTAGTIDTAIGNAAGLGVWTTNTPALTGATTNPTGQTVAGRWIQQGRVVTFFFSVTMGAVPGSGDYAISLPVPAAGMFGGTAGSARIYDSSTGSSLLGVRVAATSTTTVSLQYAVTYLGGLTNVGATNPWTWAAGDLIDGFIVYEAA